MVTGTPFSPAPFASSAVAPTTASAFRRTPYISPSEYRFAPTAVATQNLAPGSRNEGQDSLSSLAQVINRASGWIDQYCFHRGDGTLAASVTTESARVLAKPDGSLSLLCNFEPILEVTGMAVGPSPASLQNVSSSVAASIWFGVKVINVPTCWADTTPFPAWGAPAWPGGVAYVVWTYVNGFPHTYLAASCEAEATSIQLGPSTPGGSTVCGVYAGTQLTIHDGGSTEVVVAASTPTGLTLDLTAGLQYAHQVPYAPDSIRVSAIPWAIEQSCVSLTSCLIKTRGTRSQILPAIGGAPNKQALAEAGALEDFEIAADLLAPYVTPVLH